MTRQLKYQITEAVLKQLPEYNEPLEKIIRKWWYTMNSDGLRLTDSGDKIFQQIGIEFYICPITVTHYTWYKFVSDCSKKLKCPYYLGVNKRENQKAEPYIRLYDSKIAMMLTLYGDIYSYLDSIKVRQ